MRLHTGIPHNHGFTLLESIMTITLFVISVMVIFHLFSLAISADTSNENRSIALQLAREKIEQIKDADSYTAIDTFVEARTTVPGGFDGFEREVTVSGDPKQVTVSVVWDERGRENSLALTTLLAAYGY